MRNSRASTSGTRISRYITSGVVLVVVAIVAVVGIPAAALIGHHLDEQALLQVQNAQSATQRLYAAEGQRLEELAALVARDPVLGELIGQRDGAGLTAYLHDLQGDLSVDALVVRTADGQAFGPSLAQALSSGALSADRQVPFTEFAVLDDPGQVLFVAGQELRPAAAGQPLAGSRVLAVLVLDDDFMREMGRRTGLAHSLIVNGARVATSMATPPDWLPEAALTAPRLDTGMYCCIAGTAGEASYEIGVVPLADSQGGFVAYDEMTLPTGGLRAGQARVITLLFVAGFILILGASTSVILLTRRITDPLKQLTAEAHRLRDGDLDTPVSTGTGLWEIDQLAVELDRARRQLRRTHQATQREQKRIEHLLGAIREGVVAIDEDGQVTFFSADAERILGYNASRALGAPVSRIFRTPPSEIETFEETLRHPEGALPFQRLTVLDANDNPVELAVSFAWLDSETSGGVRRERVVVLRDVSEEEALERLRCDFLANVAHEFRTPLSGVIATTELLATENHSLTPKELAELTNTIRMSTMGLQALIDNLLESATIEAGCFRVRPRPIRFQDVIDRAVGTMAPLLRRRDQPLEVKVPDDLPTLWADPERLSQGLLNLLANASRFGPMGTPITLSVRQDDDTLTVAVLDSGPGLPTGRISDLFMRFVTGDQPRGAGYGVGLGLSVTKAIVEAHGGHVGAENRDEGGARVWFTLPLHLQDWT